jgi:hypothetical protein
VCVCVCVCVVQVVKLLMPGGAEMIDLITRLSCRLHAY